MVVTDTIQVGHAYMYDDNPHHSIGKFTLTLKDTRVFHSIACVHCVNFNTSINTNCFRAKKRSCSPPPPLGNFADISYLEEHFKPHLLRDVALYAPGR